MTKERQKYLNKTYDNLTEEESREWHYCDNWDGLLIHYTDVEMCACNCDPYKQMYNDNISKCDHEIVRIKQIDGFKDNDGKVVLLRNISCNKCGMWSEEEVEEDYDEDDIYWYDSRLDFYDNNIGNVEDYAKDCATNGTVFNGKVPNKNIRL